MTDLIKNIALALENKPSTNFSSEDVNTSAIKAIMAQVGLDANSSPRAIRAATQEAFALIEEACDEILPQKLQQVMGQFAEIRTFARDAEVIFDIEKIGKNRAKLTIAKGARAGIYRTAKLSNKWFSPTVTTYTAAVKVTLEELILGTASLADFFNNILEGFEEQVYSDVFNALATGTPVAGYERIMPGATIETTKANLSNAIDKVLPFVKQYGAATIFGSFQALSSIYNPLAAASGYPNLVDSQEIRERGHVTIYKGVNLVELPNYLVDNTNTTWFYDPKYVFVIPAGAKPVKVALKGDMYIQVNKEAVGGEKWEAHKIMGVGLAMANNYSVIKVTDIA